MNQSRLMLLLILIAVICAHGCGRQPQSGIASLDKLSDIVFQAYRDQDMELMRSLLLHRVDRRVRPNPVYEDLISRLISRCVSISDVELINTGQLANYIHANGNQVGAPADYDLYKVILVGTWRVGDTVEERRIDPAFIVGRFHDGTRAIFVLPLVLRDAVESLEEGREPRYRAEE